MNERLKELYQQAHSIRYHDGDPMRDGNPPTVYWQGETSAEKFAELIVRECYEHCKDQMMDRKITEEAGLGYNDGVMDCAIGLIQHFGVEE